MGSGFFDFIERLKTHPVHVRRRIAFGTAFGTTAVVAVIWMVALIHSGKLIVTPADEQNNIYANASTGINSSSSGQGSQPASLNELLGAVGAAGASTSAAVLQVVSTGQNANASTDDNATSSTVDNATYNSNYNAPTTAGTGDGQTVIPF